MGVKQFAHGGTMDGDLEITGRVFANGVEITGLSGTNANTGASGTTVYEADSVTTEGTTDVLEFDLTSASNYYLSSYNLNEGSSDIELRIADGVDGVFNIVLRKSVADTYDVNIPSDWSYSGSTASELNSASKEIFIDGFAAPNGEVFAEIRTKAYIGNVTYNDDFIIFGSDMGEENDINHDAVFASMISRAPTEIYHAGDTYPSGGYSASIDAYDAVSSYIDQKKWFHTDGNHCFDFVGTKSDLQGTVGSVILSAGDAQWDYLEVENSAPDFPTGWKTSSGSTDGFTTGAATPFGYGEAGRTPATTLDFGGNSNDKRISYLLRTQIAQSDITSDGLVFEHVFDDAFELYVNGVEVLSYMLAHPVTVTSGAENAIGASKPGAQGLTFAEYNQGYRMAVIPASLFDQSTNTVAILLKNKDGESSDLWFDCTLTNYTFPSVRSFTGSDLAYISEDSGIGIRGIAPYLPANAERYSRVVGNMEFFFISSGRNSPRDIVRGGSPNTAGNLSFDTSKNADWLANAIEASNAEFKFAVTHDSPHSHASGKSFDYQEYLYRMPSLSGLNGMLHGDDHQTQIIKKENAGGKMFYIMGASNFRNSSRTDNGIGGNDANEWTEEYFDNTAQNNYYIEMKSTTGLVRVQLIDGNNVDNDNNTIFTTYITN